MLSLESDHQIALQQSCQQQKTELSKILHEKQQIEQQMQDQLRVIKKLQLQLETMTRTAEENLHLGPRSESFPTAHVRRLDRQLG